MDSNSQNQNQKLQLYKNCNNEFAVAIQSSNLSTCTSDDLIKNLKYAMLVVGLREANFPSQMEFDFLKEFIRKNFGGNKVDEIKLAFEMAVAGKLDLGKDGCNCYENFSCEYFSRIITAYRKWSKDEAKMMQIEPTALTQEPIKKQTTNEFVEFWQKEWMESKTKNYFLFSQFTIVYDILANKKTINLTNEEKEIIKTKVKQDLMNTCKNERETFKMKENIAIDNYLQTHCKKLAVAMHFNKLS